MTSLYPLRFRPIFRQYIWGGRRLETLLGKRLGEGEHYAESWEVVDHGADQSVVSAGPLAGRSLHELVERWGMELLGRAGERRDRFPLLLKFLDAQRDLSVQVHPDDTQAARLDPPDYGKTEAWYVIHADPGSRIYAGLKAGVDRSTFERAIADGRVVECLHVVEPKPGDCLFVPARTVHALGAGVLVAELQQSSDTTYRIYDWDRLGADGRPRELHIAQALEVIDFERGPIEPVTMPADAGDQVLVRCSAFTWRCRRLGRRSASFQWPSSTSFHLLTVIDGSVRVSGDPTGEPLGRGQTMLIPAACPVRVELVCERAVVLDGYVDPDQTPIGGPDSGD